MSDYQYMLDTNICIYAINHQPEVVAKKLIEVGEQACCISSIVASELAFGVEKSGSVKNKIKLNAFLSLFDLVAYDENCIWHYAKVRQHLQSTGNVIGSLDMLIASHALSMNTCLVTNNTKEFQRVDGLMLDNWV